MTVMQGLPATDQTPIISVYYATVMVLTTAATVTGVLILSIHHKGREGVLVPPHLRRVARSLAVLTCSSYPQVDRQLDNLNQGLYRPIPSEKYCYNIREKMQDFRKTRPWQRG